MLEQVAQGLGPSSFEYLQEQGCLLHLLSGVMQILTGNRAGSKLTTSSIYFYLIKRDIWWKLFQFKVLSN